HGFGGEGEKKSWLAACEPATRQGMNKTTTHKPTRGSFSLLHQLCNLIPAHLVPKLARDTGVSKRSRTFTPWSHVVSLLYAQLTHAIGLNDVCDALRLHSGPLSAVRGATPPSKNALSTANRERSAQMAQDLFYAVLGHLETLHPGFGRDRRPRFAFRFKRVIHLVDATTIQLVARCLDWAKHRRRKAAAKCHLRLDLQTFLPRFALVDTAGEHESRQARVVCAGQAVDGGGWRKTTLAGDHQQLARPRGSDAIGTGVPRGVGGAGDRSTARLRPDRRRRQALCADRHAGLYPHCRIAQYRDRKAERSRYPRSRSGPQAHQGHGLRFHLSVAAARRCGLALGSDRAILAGTGLNTDNRHRP